MTLQQMEENLNTLRNELAARIAPMEAQLSDLSAWRGGVDHNMLHYHKCFETLLPMHGKIRGGTFGIAAGLSEGRVRIDFGRTFPSQPVVVATMLSPHELIVVETYNVTTTGFDAWVVRLRPGAWAAEQVIQWIAIVPW